MLSEKYIIFIIGLLVAVKFIFSMEKSSNVDLLPYILVLLGIAILPKQMYIFLLLLIILAIIVHVSTRKENFREKWIGTQGNSLYISAGQAGNLPQNIYDSSAVNEKVDENRKIQSRNSKSLERVDSKIKDIEDRIVKVQNLQKEFNEKSREKLVTRTAGNIINYRIYRKPSEETQLNELKKKFSELLTEKNSEKKYANALLSNEIRQYENDIRVIKSFNICRGQKRYRRNSDIINFYVKNYNRYLDEIINYYNVNEKIDRGAMLGFVSKLREKRRELNSMIDSYTEKVDNMVVTEEEQDVDIDYNCK